VLRPDHGVRQVRRIRFCPAPQSDDMCRLNGTTLIRIQNRSITGDSARSSDHYLMVDAFNREPFRAASHFP
jgi:hypothetical protein